MKLLLFIIVLSVPAAGLCTDRPLKVGVLLPLSGQFAAFGGDIKKGIEFAAGPEVRLVFEDTRFDNKTALSALQKLVTFEHPDFLISGGGETCEVINREAQRLKLIHIAVGCNTAQFNDPDSYNFRLDVNERAAAKTTARYLAHRGVHRAALLHIANNWGETVIRATRAAMEAAGVSITDSISFPDTGAGSLRGEFTRMRAHSPELLFFVAPPESTAVILKQLGELNLRLPLMSTISIQNPRVLELAGGQADGITYLAVKKEQRSRAAHKRFFAQFPDAPTFISWGYDSLNMAREASASGDAKNYLQNLRGYLGAFAVYNYDKRGELELPYEIRIIKDGRFESLENLPDYSSSDSS